MTNIFTSGKKTQGWYKNSNLYTNGLFDPQPKLHKGKQLLKYIFFECNGLAHVGGSNTTGAKHCKWRAGLGYQWQQAPMTLLKAKLWTSRLSSLGMGTAEKQRAWERRKQKTGEHSAHDSAQLVVVMVAAGGEQWYESFQRREEEKQCIQCEWVHMGHESTVQVEEWARPHSIKHIPREVQVVGGGMVGGDGLSRWEMLRWRVNS